MGHAESLLASGRVSHVISSLAMVRTELEGRRECRGRFPHTALPVCLCLFSKKCTGVETETGQDL